MNNIYTIPSFAVHVPIKIQYRVDAKRASNRQRLLHKIKDPYDFQLYIIIINYVVSCFCVISNADARFLLIISRTITQQLLVGVCK